MHSNKKANKNALEGKYLKTHECFSGILGMDNVSLVFQHDNKIYRSMVLPFYSVVCKGIYIALLTSTI